LSPSSDERIPYDVFALADIQGDRYRVLADRVVARLSEFECGRSTHLQKFARESVDKWEKHGHSRTYVIITPVDDDIAVAGFFTVGMTGLDLSQATKSARNKLMGSISLERTGAFSIAELARSDSYTSAQLPGSVILDEAKEVIKRARGYVGGRFVVVDARQKVFDALYEPAGFKRISVAVAPLGMDDTDFVTACCVVVDW
jgi:hypothetical protein